MLVYQRVSVSSIFCGSTLLFIAGSMGMDLLKVMFLLELARTVE
jgi:hypothetical protein